MPFKKLAKQIAKRADGLDWEDRAPGLYDGEIAVALDSGEKVAVSVVPEWLENGGGVAFKGNARWVEDDGMTKLARGEAHVEAAFSLTATMSDAEEFGVPALATEIARLVLGEPPQLMRAADPALDVPAMPVVSIPPDVLDSISIRKAISAVNATEGFTLSLT